MKIRVIGGTPRHDGSLCLSCGNRQIRKGTRLSDEWYGCDIFPATRIPQPVTECSEHADVRFRIPMEAVQQAWRWVPSLGTFLSPQEWNQARSKKALQQHDYDYA